MEESQRWVTLDYLYMYSIPMNIQLRYMEESYHLVILDMHWPIHVIMMVTDVLTPIKRQATSNQHGDWLECRNFVRFITTHSIGLHDNQQPTKYVLERFGCV